VGGEKVDFEPLPTDPTNPENPTDPYDPTRDLLIALIFIVVGFGATVLLVFTLKKPKNKTKEE
jgi:LPS O-antigen subunit length determinant protein (WzzB/FepE family)